MVLTINPVPVVSIGGNNFFCTGGSTVLSANVSAGGPATSWSWSIGGSPISGANSATYSASVAGDYTVTVSNSFGCSSTSSILTVSENTPPTAPTISPAGPLSICNGSSVVLTSSYASGNTWSSGATTESITVTAKWKLHRYLHRWQRLQRNFCSCQRDGHRRQRQHYARRVDHLLRWRFSAVSANRHRLPLVQRCHHAGHLCQNRWQLFSDCHGCKRLQCHLHLNRLL